VGDGPGRLERPEFERGGVRFRLRLAHRERHRRRLRGALLDADTGRLGQVTKLANTKLDECRRRVQNETLGHRGRKSDPLYRCRRLLTKGKERLDEKGTEKLMGLLRAGDPTGEVATRWEAKAAVRELNALADSEVALE
jgi:hypothetical protein